MPFFKKQEPENEMFFERNDELIPIPELDLTLDDIYFLFTLVSEYSYSAPNPTAKRYAKNLGTGLMQVWTHWSKKTNDTSRFMLKIKR